MPKLLVMYSNEPPTRDHSARLQRLCPDKEVVVIDSDLAAVAHAADAEIILGHRYLRQTLPHTRALKWIQSTAGGVHHLISPTLQQKGPILTRCPIFADIIALHAFALALAVSRRVPECVRSQERGVWERPSYILPPPQTAMILGMGVIGRSLAATLRANHIAVLGVNRKHTVEVEAACDELLDYESWRRHLGRIDLLFVTLPLTKTTSHLINETVMQALPRHAIIVNVGRSAVIDLPALVIQLEKGQLGGAALDVLDPIPRSKLDSFWSTPNLLITAKAATFFHGRQARLEAFIEAQIKRYTGGIDLLHQVDIDEIIYEVRLS